MNFVKQRCVILRLPVTVRETSMYKITGVGVFCDVVPYVHVHSGSACGSVQLGL